MSAGGDAREESAVKPADVDAYWLQRRVGQCFPDMGAAEAQTLAEQAFTILQACGFYAIRSSHCTHAVAGGVACAACSGKWGSVLP